MRSALRSWLAEATNQRRLNGWLVPLWIIFGVVGVFTSLKSSIPVLFFVSVYANAAGHLSAWQAAKVEVSQEQAHE